VWEDEEIILQYGEIRNLTKSLDVGPNEAMPTFEFSIDGGDENNTLLINNERTYTIIPNRDPLHWKNIVVTSQQADFTGSSQITSKLKLHTNRKLFLIVLFDNQLDRYVQVKPSRSSREAYYVEPQGFLQVNITIDSRDPPHALVFKAFDQLLHSPLLINGTISASLAPGVQSDVIHNLTITPQTLAVIPSHSYAFMDIQNSEIAGYPVLHVTGDVTTLDDDHGIAMNGTSSWLSGQFKKNDCVLDPGMCDNGFTIALKIKFDKANIKKDTAGGLNKEYNFIMDTGAHGGTQRGVSMLLNGEKLLCQLTTKTKTWTVESQVPVNQWTMIIVTWSTKIGLMLYYDAQLKAKDPTGTEIQETDLVESNPNLAIGRNLHGPSFAFGRFHLASFTTFNSYIKEQEIINTSIFFWSTYMARAYYSIIRLSNNAGRDIKLQPDKGRRDGFLIHPNKQMEITLIDLY